MLDIGCLALMDGLERNQRLKELNLSGNFLRVPSAKRISEVLLAENLKLESLLLSNNYLGDQGGNLIARALALNPRMKKVDLFDNYLNDESAKQLATCLSRNRSLRHINLGFNACNHRYVTQVAQLAKKNIERERRNVIPRSVKEIIRLSSKAEQRQGLEEKIKEVEVKKTIAQERYRALDLKYEHLQKDARAVRQIFEVQSSELGKKLGKVDAEVTGVEERARKVRAER